MFKKQLQRKFWYETPSGREVLIYFDDIEMVALNQGDERMVEDMPDEDFYRYCEFLVEE